MNTMADEPCSKLSASSDEKGVTKDTARKDKRSDLESCAKDGKLLKLLTKAVPLSNSLRNVKESLQKSEALFNEVSPEGKALGVDPVEEEKVENSSGLKTSGNNYCAHDVILAENENEKLRQENKRLEERFEILEGKLQVAKEEVGNKEAELNQLKKRNKKLKKDLSESKLEEDELLEGFGDVTREVRGLKRKLMEKEHKKVLPKVLNKGNKKPEIKKKEKDETVRASSSRMDGGGKVSRLVDEMKDNCVDMDLGESKRDETDNLLKVANGDPFYQNSDEQ